MEYQIIDNNIEVLITSKDIDAWNFYEKYTECFPVCMDLVRGLFDDFQKEQDYSASSNFSKVNLKQEFINKKLPNVHVLLTDIQDGEFEFIFDDSRAFRELIALIKSNEIKRIPKFLNDDFLLLLEDYRKLEFDRIDFSRETDKQKDLLKESIADEMDFVKLYHKECLLAGVLTHFIKEGFKKDDVSQHVGNQLKSDLIRKEKVERKENRMGLDAALLATCYIFESLGSSFSELLLEDKVRVFEFFSGYGDLKTKIENRTVTKKIGKYWPKEDDKIKEFHQKDVLLVKKYFNISGLKKPLKLLERDYSF